MIYILPKTFHAFTKILILLITFLLVIISLSILFFPYIVRYQSEITQKISTLIEKPINVSHMSARWRGLYPTIEFDNVQVFDDTHLMELLQLRKIKMRINVFASLLHRRVILYDMTISGGHVVIRQFPDKSISINGIPMASDGRAQDTTYFRRVNYYFEDMNVTWQRDNDTVLSLYHVKGSHVDNISYINSQNVILDLPKQLAKPLTFDLLTFKLIFLADNNSWTVNVTDMKLKNTEVDLGGKLTLASNQNNTLMDLLVDYSMDNPASLPNYIPTNYLPPKLGITGNAIQGKLHIKGPLAQFPFKDNMGHIRASISLKNINLRLFSNWPMVENINGEVTIDYPQINTTQLTANWLGEPFVLQAITKNRDYYVTARGVMPIAELVKITHLSFLEKIADGKIPFNVEWDNRVRLLSIHSNLQGLALTLPPPLGKAGNEMTPSTITILLGNEIKLTADYAKRLNAALIIKANNTGWTLQNAHIQVPHLVVAGFPLQHTTIQVTPIKNTWAIYIKNRDMAGKIIFPENLNSQPLTIHFDRFALASAAVKKIESTNTPRIILHPQDIPTLNILFNRFYYDKVNLGTIQLTTRKRNNTLIIEKFSIMSPDLTLLMTGYWDDLHNLTALKGNIKATNFGDFLKDWHITESLEGSEGTVDFTLNWQGPIYQFNLPRLNGKFTFSLKDGVILDIIDSNTEMVGRILNIISIDSLEFILAKPFGIIAPQRKGFDFTVEKAEVNIVNGTLQSDSFYLHGKLAEVESQGRINLVKRDYNLYVTITPFLTAFLPMNLALAGGPVMLGIVWAADKLMGGVLNSYFRKTYYVTGSWQNPHYEKVTDPPAKQQPQMTSPYKK